MQLATVVVSGALMGFLAPSVAHMSIQPIMAQKRSVNFSVAEAAAVSYAGKNEQGLSLTPVPDICNVVEIEDKTYSITCVEGEGQFRQSATRTFRLATLGDGDEDSSGYEAPHAYTPGIYCPLWDPWGVQSYNEANNVQCIPVPYSHWAHLYDGEMLW